MDFEVDRPPSRFCGIEGLEHGGSTVQIRIREPLVLGLLMACCCSMASAQINSGYFTHHGQVPVAEPYYDTECLTTGCYRDPSACWLGQASFDVLMFSRSDADSRTIVTESPSGNPILNTTDLGFPVTAGFRLNLVLTGDDGCDLVFNYLGARFENSHVNFAATASYNLFEFPDLGPTTGASFQTSYTSTLTSIEVNSRTRRWNRFAPLAGLRFMNLEDQFDRLSAGASSQLNSTVASNNLWGCQIGGEALLWDAGSVRLQSTLKGGVFYNDLHLNVESSGITSTDPLTMVSTTIDPSSTFSSDHISFFGELNLELAYQICPQVAIRVGYTAMWMDGVALAPDQHDDFVLTSGMGGFDYGTVLHHGSYVGAEVTW